MFKQKDRQKEIESFVSNAQMSTMIIEMAVTMYLMGAAGASETVTNIAGKATAKVATKLGTSAAQKVVQHGVKAAFTTAGAMIAPAETLASGLTSKNGITEQTLEMAGEQAKSGLIFGAFGAYVSAPLGDKLVSILRANPNVTSALLQKVFSGAGFATEVGLDAVFEMAISDGDFSSLLAENAGGEVMGRVMQMLVGGQAHRAAKQVMEGIKLEQRVEADGSTTYLVKDDNGNICYETQKPEEVIAGMLATAEGVNKGVNETGSLDQPATPHGKKG